MAVLSANKILIADDSDLNRELLREILDDRYTVLEARDGEEVLQILSEEGDGISLLLLDIVMPKLDGFQVLLSMHKQHLIEQIPVVMISAENTSSTIRHAYDLGVTDYISRPFDAEVVRKRISNTLALYAKQRRLVEMITDEIYQKQKSNSIIINILSNIVEVRNGESGMHVLHVNLLTELLLRGVCRKTDRYGITQEDIETIGMCAALHDIGKIVIPDHVLNKPGRLTAEEFQLMKTHTTAGAEMLTRVPYDQDEPLLKHARDICLWHHERYDGRGYPDGLSGDQIPISAQVVSLADVYDALTSDRVYKKAYPHETAVQMILNGECGTFNPLLIEVFLEEMPTILRELAVNSYTNQDKSAIVSRTMRRIDRESAQSV